MSHVNRCIAFPPVPRRGAVGCLPVLTAAQEGTFTYRGKREKAGRRLEKIAGPVNGRASSYVYSALGAELLEEAARAAAVGDHALGIHRARPVHPHPVQSDRRRVESRGARGQVVHATLLASPHRGGIEED